MTDRERAAFHESGHAVMAHRFHRAPRVVRIADDGTGNTICRELNADARHRFSPERYRQLAIEEVHVWSAGAIAEEIFAGTSDPSNARVDAERVRFWLHELGLGSGRTLAGATRRMLTDPQDVASRRSAGRAPLRTWLADRKRSATALPGAQSPPVNRRFRIGWRNRSFDILRCPWP